jgi:lysophospholipase L1-like esterase
VAADRLARRAAAFAIPLLVFVSAGEGAVRLYTRHHLVYDLEMTRYARELKIDAADPAIGHVHRPRAEADLMGVHVTINADGLRDRDYPIPRGPAYRMIVLGDSLTFGWGVPQAQTFENLMEGAINRRRPAEILNFGIGNYNTSQETALFVDRGLKYAPDKVVLFYFINDAEPTPRASRWSVLARSEFLSFFWSRMRRLAGLASATGGYRDYYSSLYAAGARGWLDAQAALLRLQAACRERSIALQVVLLPELHQLRPYPFATEHAAVSAFLQAHGIDHLDLAPFFDRAVDPSRLWVAPDDAHPNAAGHRLIAEYTLPFVFPREGMPRDAAPAVAKQ